MAVTVLVGRVLMSVIFILSGVHKIFDYSGTVGFMAQHHLPAFLAIPAIVVEIGGGLCLALGLGGRAAAIVLAAFLIPTTLVFHTSLVVVQTQDQSVNFLKNLTIIGGLLMAAGQGPGPLSIDALRRG